MNQESIKRQVVLMREQGLDAMIALSHQNFAWVTGFVVPTHPIMRWRHTGVVTTSDGRTALYTLSMEEKTIRQYEPDADAWIWEEFEDNAFPVFIEMLKSLGLESARIGIETDMIQANFWEALQAGLPQVSWVAVQDHFDKLRFIKTPEEVDRIRHLSKLTDKSLGEALAEIRPGQTEMALAGALGGAIYRNGAENFPIMVNCSGNRTVIPNAGPTKKVLEPGDPVRLEAFGVIGGYTAGVARSAYVEKLSPDIEHAYSVLIKGRDFYLRALEPGASTLEIFKGYAKILEEGGLPVFNFLGHGVGLNLHEKPYLERNSDYELQENMVLGMESVVLDSDLGFGLQIKDIVGITDTGVELFSDVTDVQQIIRIGD